MRGTPPFHRALEALADYEWHDFADVVLVVMLEVEPAKAVRRAECQRAYVSGAAERRRSASPFDLVMIGARSIATEVLIKGSRFQVQWLAGSGWTDRAADAPRLARRRVRLAPNYRSSKVGKVLDGPTQLPEEPIGSPVVGALIVGGEEVQAAQ